MSTLLKRFWTEPALFFSAVSAIVNIGLAYASLPVWAHASLVAVSAVLAGVGTRARVRPIAHRRRR